MAEGWTSSLGREIENMQVTKITSLLMNATRFWLKPAKSLCLIWPRYCDK